MNKSFCAKLHVPEKLLYPKAAKRGLLMFISLCRWEDAEYWNGNMVIYTEIWDEDERNNKKKFSFSHYPHLILIWSHTHEMTFRFSLLELFPWKENSVSKTIFSSSSLIKVAKEEKSCVGMKEKIFWLQ